MLHVKKTTQVSWEDPGSGFIAETGIRSQEKFAGGQPARIRLVKIDSKTENGKNGHIRLVFEDFQRHLCKEDAEHITEWIDPWRLNFDATICAEPDTFFSFGVSVPNGKGFCETIIEMVSALATLLKVSNSYWFIDTLDIKQMTYMRASAGDLWLPYGDFMVKKYPIHTEPFVA